MGIDGIGHHGHGANALFRELVAAQQSVQEQVFSEALAFGANISREAAQKDHGSVVIFGDLLDVLVGNQIAAEAFARQSVVTNDVLMIVQSHKAGSQTLAHVLTCLLKNVVNEGRFLAHKVFSVVGFVQ